MKKFNWIIPLIAMSVGGFANAGNRLESDIVDTAVAAGNFKTLAAALGAADLVATLKSDGPFTVFAPTDSAFAKLPTGTVEALLNDIPALTNILVYHVVAGEKSPRQLLSAGTATTVQGKDVEIRKMSNGLFINGSKVEAVIRVKNGIIYVVDTVLLP
jgi:uncharacterized surface protein with fasciclin (FAS1) repeats